MKTQKALIAIFKHGKPIHLTIIPEFEIINPNDIPRITRKRGKQKMKNPTKSERNAYATWATLYQYAYERGLIK
jgi:hypothetical protein